MQHKNIVLLSDGTGNSAALISRTNVWRIYEAVDLSKGDQVAFYDDGVGTSGIKILRVLGGALGLGFSRNVRQLFEQLCRHYSEQNSKIFIFGFSRGAFTARTLAGLIVGCGIVDRKSGKKIPVWRWSKLRHENVGLDTDEGLKLAVRHAYRSYRLKYDTALLIRVYRKIRSLFPGTTLSQTQFRQTYSVSPRPRIAFLGVFDTVDAVGLPIDELDILLHNHIYPHRFPNMILSSKVETACHAVALDDERQTFHPVLWTERKFGSEEPDPRPEQVWFSGMHSNVGGGYPDDGLALIPCLWMVDRAVESAGLRVDEISYGRLQVAAASSGKIYDSRSGLQSFYRYKPRLLSELGRQDVDGNGYEEVWIDRFKIHESVFERIRDSGADYAPLGIPNDYDVVRQKKSASKKGQSRYEIVSAQVAGYETRTQRSARVQIQRRIAHQIFLRSCLYVVMFSAAAILFLVPMLWLPNSAAIPSGIAASLVGALSSLLAYVPIPRVENIGQFWHQNSVSFLVLATTYASAYFGSRILARRIHAISQEAWTGGATTQPSKAAGGASLEHPTKSEILRDRASPFYTWLKTRAVPWAALIMLFVVLPLVVIWRFYLFSPLNFASVCEAVHAGKPVHKEVAGSLNGPIRFETSDPCMNTGVTLQKGREYRLVIEIPKDGSWMDGEKGGFPADPTGLVWEELSLKESLVMASLSLTRNFYSEDWFGLMGSIGRARSQTFRINVERAVAKMSGLDNTDSTDHRYESSCESRENGMTCVYDFFAWRSGRLYLFVNDAINACRWSFVCSWVDRYGIPKDEPGRFSGRGVKPSAWWAFYTNNKGYANVTIREIAER